MEGIIFRRALNEEMPDIVVMQSNIFGVEQGIPSEDLNTFMEKDPICWCAEINGKICASAAAWREKGETHWGRFAVLPSMRRRHIGSRLARLSFNELFEGGADIIYMEARDTTVKIVCSMGGKINGNPFKFYNGNVTPVILKKEDYLRI